MRSPLQFLGRHWIWWVPPLVVAAILAVTLLWLYSGDASSPFAYPAY